MNEVLEEYVIPFLTGNFSYAAECQALGIAFQGAMGVRNTINKDRNLHWFHAFVLSLLAGFAGGLTGFAIMGLPSAVIASDIGLAAAIIAFVVTNCIPFDLGYKLANSLPGTVLMVSCAQLFRSNGLTRFIHKAFTTFEHNPTKYYPTPVLGPILYGTLLGNMNGFIMKGIEGMFKNGIPWPFQNGFFCGTFYHFYVHDTKGVIGEVLRDVVYLTGLQESHPALQKMDDKTFAFLLVSIFMQVTGILQTKHFLGPTFSPFNIFSLSRSSSSSVPIIKPKKDLSSILDKKSSSSKQKEEEEDEVVTHVTSKSKKNKRKKRGGGNKQKQT